jgi:hypothetical protein
MPVGWEPDDDGFRGYVFATEDNSAVVLTIKGKSVPIIDGGPTAEKDKLNDTLLFSCCCARVSRTWTHTRRSLLPSVSPSLPRSTQFHISARTFISKPCFFPTGNPAHPASPSTHSTSIAPYSKPEISYTPLASHSTSIGSHSKT